jgi:DeoR/GlpR family transcriptional regulator of sugar metabolism
VLEDAALVERRRRWLVDALREHQRIVTNDAADELGVSVDTVRRDLRALDADGLVRRVHGGAVPRSSLPSSYAGRRSVADGARTRLASAVVQRIRPHTVVGLDAGTTNVEVVRLLPRDLAVTIVTNSPPAAAELAGHPSARVVLIGGIVDLDWMATTGPDAVAAWAGYRLDLGVVGMCAVDPHLGGSTNSLAEVATKRAIIAASAEVVVPVQLDKLATTASFVVCPTSEIDGIITDADADQETVVSFRGLGVDVTLV